MSTRAKTFAAVAALAAFVVACSGTAQAGPTVYTVPNYSFQNWTVWNNADQPVETFPPTPLGDGQQTPPTANNFYPQPDYWALVYGGNSTNFSMWNPTSADFATAGGVNGSLPGTAAGSTCFLNNGTTSGQDIGFVNGTLDGTGGAAIPNATLAANKRYTITIAIGSPTTATIMDGQSFCFADITYGGLLLEHDDMYPTPTAANNHGAFLGYGSFGDISLSMSSAEMLAIGGVHIGDGLLMNVNPGAGTCWSNARMISQNWVPMYTNSTQGSQGTVVWESSVWSNTSGSGYSNAWTTGRDAVFEGTGGTVTVSTTVAANSLNFNNDWNGTGYTISGTGTINLTGDAVITTGAGTDNTSNVGGGINTISCVLGGSVGMYKAGGGTLILAATNTYTGGTTVGAGTLQIGNGGTSGSIVGNVSNLANLAFNHSGTFTYGGVISGTGSVDIAGPTSSTTIFTGAHLYTGATTIHNGNTLQLGPGGSLTGETYVNGTTAVLAFNRTDTMTYAGSIFGSGGVTQMSTGHTILTGANSYTGTTTVQHGYLEINNATAVTNLISAGANLTGGELMLDYTGASPIASVLAALTSGKITDSAIPIHSGPGAMALGWKDTGTQIDILPTLIGDTDLNGTVDNNDLGQLLKYFNKAGGWPQGDFSYLGTVNNNDLGALLANFNHAPLTLPLVVGGANPVPEPSSLIMLTTLLALTGAWGIRRRRNEVA